jgi:MoaA/NifB/PqqE/SkfB family radical SAM enzyme
VSDAITRAPGTHARTVRGVQALLAAGVPVKLNAVMTQEGLAELHALPDFVAEAFGPWRERLLGLMFSYPTTPWDPSLVPMISPEPGLLRAELRRALDRALALGLHPHGLDGPCGPQLCAFGADPRVASLAPVPEPVDFRHKLPACEGCAVADACFGVRDSDVALYGDACVAPVGQRG